MSAGPTATGFWHVASAGLLLRVASAFFGFLATLLMARVLGADGYGAYAFILALVSLLGIPTQAGVPLLTLRETARGVALGAWTDVADLWRWGRRVILGATLGLVGLVIVFMLVLRPGLESALVSTGAWGLILLPLVGLGNLYGAALRGLDRVVAGQLPEMCIRPAALAGGVFIAVVAGVRLTPQFAMGIHAAAAATSLVVGVLLLWRWQPEAVANARPGGSGAFRRIGAALPLALITGMHLVNANTDIVMLGLLASDVEVGVYRVAVQVASVVGFGILAANMVVSSKIAASHARDDRAEVQRLAVAGARMALVVAAPVTLIFVLTGRPLLELAFGGEYVVGFHALVWLSLAQLLNAVFGSVGVLLNMTGHETVTLWGVGSAAVLNVILNLALIPGYGVNGAAVATLITFLVWNLILWRAVRRYLGVWSLPWSPSGLP